MIRFELDTVFARFLLPTGERVDAPVEIRRNPITGRTCRIAFSRTGEREAATDSLPAPPPFAADTSQCPFCAERLASRTPMARPELAPAGRLVRGASILFPNLFPYGAYSAVSLFDDRHFVEIGSASAASYADSFRNSADYLARVLACDPQARFVAITQNHLPSAGGSLLHPHLQIQADRLPSNHHRFMAQRAAAHLQQTGRLLLADYLAHEKADGRRIIGATGAWEWLAAFAPEGFYEIWGILPGATSIARAREAVWEDLAAGVIRAQRFYRSLNRNGYNLGILAVEEASSALELRVVILARANYAPWVRSDHTGFELMLGDMATFTAPEETARAARPFWRAAAEAGVAKPPGR
jgi:galactose-1-phosphate uridylyltransferase